MPILNNLTVNDLGEPQIIPMEINNGVLSRPTSNYTFTVPPEVTELATDSFNHMFTGAGGWGANNTLVGIDFNNVEVVNDGACMQLCTFTPVTSVLCPKVKRIGGQAFEYAFQNCSYLTSLSFPSLETIASNAFGRSNTNYAFKSSGVTALHFPAAVQAQVEAMSGYPTFGGSVTVYFDL